MSLRRTEKTVESLWRAMNTPILHARQSPTPYDIEDYKGHGNGDPVDVAQPPSAPQMQPPRLAGPGSCTRLLLAILCLSCFGVVCFVVTIVVNHLSIHHPAQPAVPPRPLPALLKRFAKLKKATAGARGASRASVNDLFPHWGMGEADEADNIVKPALRDLALGVAMLAQHLQPVAEPEAPPPESTLSEDTDL